MAHKQLHYRNARLIVALGVSLAVVALVLAGVVFFWPKGVVDTDPPRVNMWAIAADGVDDLVAVGGSDDDKGGLVLAKSLDGGATWVVSDPDAPAMTHLGRAGNRLVTSVACLPPTIGGDPVGEGPDSCVYVSDDDGATWRDIDAGRLVDPTFSDESYGWTHPPFPVEGPLFHTFDGGLTWSSFAEPCPADTPTIYASVAVAPESGYVICFGPVSGSRQAWSLIEWVTNSATVRFSGNIDYGNDPEGLSSDFVQGFTMRADGAGLIWTSNSTYRSADGGSTWQPMSQEGLDRGFFRGGGTMPDVDHAFLVRRGPYSSIVEWQDGQWHSLISWPFEGGPRTASP